MNKPRPLLLSVLAVLALATLTGIAQDPIKRNPITTAAGGSTAYTNAVRDTVAGSLLTFGADTLGVNGHVTSSGNLTGSNLVSVSTGNGSWVLKDAGGNTIATSTNGGGWYLNPMYAKEFNSSGTGNGSWLLKDGSGNTIATSTNGGGWFLNPMYASEFNSAGAGNGSWLLKDGGGNTIATSTNGGAWFLNPLYAPVVTATSFYGTNVVANDITANNIVTTNGNGILTGYDTNGAVMWRLDASTGTITANNIVTTNGNGVLRGYDTNNTVRWSLDASTGTIVASNVYTTNLIAGTLLSQTGSVSNLVSTNILSANIGATDANFTNLNGGNIVATNIVTTNGSGLLRGYDTNGTARWTLDASSGGISGSNVLATNVYALNKIGVGTNNPQTAVHVRGAISADGDASSFILNRRDTGVTAWQMYSPGDTLRFYNSGSDAGYGDAVALKNNGYLGVGTNNPQMRLHVVGSSPGITIEDVGGARSFIQQLATGSGGQLRLFDGTVYNTYWYQGSMGLGTNLPQAKLHIVGGGAQIDGSLTAQNAYVYNMFTRVASSYDVGQSGIPWRTVYANSMNVSNVDYIGVTVAGLPTPAATHYPMMYCTDVVTAQGVGGYVRWDGSAWKTWENTTATANMRQYILNARAAGVNLNTPVSTSYFAENGAMALMPGRYYAASGTGAAGGWWGSSAYGQYLGFYTGTATNGYVRAYASYVPAMPSGDYYSSGGAYSASALSDGTDIYWCMAGTDNGYENYYVTNGIVWVYDPANITGVLTAGSISGASTNNWLCVCASNANYTVFDSGLPMSTSTTAPSRLVTVNTSTNAVFYTNGVACFTTSTNIPTTVLYHNRVVINKVAGTTARNLYEWWPSFFWRRGTARAY